MKLLIILLFRWQQYLFILHSSSSFLECHLLSLSDLLDKYHCKLKRSLAVTIKNTGEWMSAWNSMASLSLFTSQRPLIYWSYWLSHIFFFLLIDKWMERCQALIGWLVFFSVCIWSKQNVMIIFSLFFSLSLYQSQINYILKLCHPDNLKGK